MVRPLCCALPRHPHRTGSQTQPGVTVGGYRGNGCSTAWAGLPSGHHEAFMTALDDVGPSDAVVAVAGEVDCRAHLARDDERVERLAGLAAGRYAVFLRDLMKQGYEVLAWGVPAATRRTIDEGQGNTPTAGSESARNRAVVVFNEAMQVHMGKRFISIHDLTVGEDGRANLNVYAPDGVHLSRALWPRASQRLSCAIGEVFPEVVLCE